MLCVAVRCFQRHLGFATLRLYPQNGFWLARHHTLLLAVAWHKVPPAASPIPVWAVSQCLAPGKALHAGRGTASSPFRVLVCFSL
jgi:hypothetical protein